MFLFCLYDLVEVVTIICSWLQLICICCDSLVLGKVFEHYLENVSHAKPNIGNTFPPYFSKHNQTNENLFLFAKYFQLKIFHNWRLFYMFPNTPLNTTFF